jgi:hypothetical protein
VTLEEETGFRTTLGISASFDLTYNPHSFNFTVWLIHFDLPGAFSNVGVSLGWSIEGEPPLFNKVV